MTRAYDKKVKRLIRLYDRLHAGQRVYPPDAAEEFGVSVRSLQRDLAVLQEMYVQLRTVEVEGKRCYVMLEEARKFPIMFEMADLIVAVLSLRMMQQYEGTGLGNYLSDLAGKISDRLGRTMADRAVRVHRKFYARQPFRRNYAAQEDEVDDILTALVYEKKLKIRYQPANAERKWHEISPLCLFAYKSGLYLAAYTDRHPEPAEPTVFALERVLGTRRLSSQFEYPEDWNPERFLARFAGLVPGEDEDVEIAFDPALRVYLESLSWPAGGKLFEEGDRLVLRARVNTSQEFLHWVIGFGSRARVHAPATLVRRIKDHLRGTLAAYR